MGTSTSSKGGGSRSPFDPEWLSPPEGGNGGDSPAPGDGEGPPPADANDANADGQGDAVGGEEGDLTGPALAPDRRFAPARSGMSAFLGGGGREALRSATKSMVSKGMGGPRRAAATMRATAQGAGQLGQFLASARDATDPRIVDWVQRVRAQNLSANDLVLEVVKEVLPSTGSVDEESIRNAAAEALGQLYEVAPEVDIFNLTDAQIGDLIGYIVANDLCNRVDLQLGQTYEKLKFDARQIQLYRNDIKEYVNAQVKVVLDRQGPRGIDHQRLASEVLASTLEVFVE